MSWCVLYIKLEVAVFVTAHGSVFSQLHITGETPPLNLKKKGEKKERDNLF